METAAITYQEEVLKDVPQIDLSAKPLQPAIVSNVPGGLVYFEYPSGASVLFNPATQEQQFSNMAELPDDLKDLIPDVALLNQGHGNLFGGDAVSAFPMEQEAAAVPVSQYNVVSDADVTTVTERVPENIFDCSDADPMWAAL